MRTEAFPYLRGLSSQSRLRNCGVRVLSCFGELRPCITTRDKGLVVENRLDVTAFPLPLLDWLQIRHEGLRHLIRWGLAGTVSRSFNFFLILSCLACYHILSLSRLLARRSRTEACQKNASKPHLKSLRELQEKKKKGGPPHSIRSCHGTWQKLRYRLTDFASSGQPNLNQCDQNWPTCTACERNSIICSGPSSLVKFVSHGDGRNKSGMSLETQPQQKPADPNKPVAMIESKPWIRLGEDGASQAVFRLQGLRIPATTVAERVSRRLFALLEDGHETVTVMKMSYLPHTPQRIAHSTCLRDCAAFFCSAWADYRRREPAENLLAPRLCVKAVKSLQQVLNHGKGYTPETLAAMNMLERAVSLFGVGKAPNLELHLRGIRHVLMENPAPDILDPFDLGAAFESVCILVSTS